MILPYGLLSEVDYHLRAHLSKKSSSRDSLSDNSLSRSSSSSSIVNDDRFYEQQEPLIRNSAMEKILQRRSLNLRYKQLEWQVTFSSSSPLLSFYLRHSASLFHILVSLQETPEGQKMLELRKSLPAYKSREALLKTISENQVSYYYMTFFYLIDCFLFCCIYSFMCSCFSSRRVTSVCFRFLAVHLFQY